jgi:hypothetical protein
MFGRPCYAVPLSVFVWQGESAKAGHLDLIGQHDTACERTIHHRVTTMPLQRFAST